MSTFVGLELPEKKPAKKKAAKPAEPEQKPAAEPEQPEQKA